MNDLLASGIELMLLGMGSVFVFLVLLIVATSLMSKVVQNFEVEPQEMDIPSGEFSHSAMPSNLDDKITRIISEAIKQHRSSE